MAFIKGFSGIRIRLLALVLFAVVPAFAVLLFTAMSEVRYEVDRALEEAHRLAMFASEHNNGAVNGTRHLLIGLSRLPQITDKREQECSDLFSGLLDVYSRYENIIYVDNSGRIVCSGRPITISRIPTNTEWFTQAASADGFYFGTYKLGLVTGATEFTLAYPVTGRSGELNGILAASFNLSWFNRIAAESQLPEGATMTVVDSDGKILARHPDAEGLIGKGIGQSAMDKLKNERDGMFTAIGLNGVERLFGFTTLSSLKTNVRLLVGIPKESAYSAVDKVFFYITVWVAFSVLLLISAWIGGGMFVMRRINALVKATKKISEGDLTARTGLKYGMGELGQLARAFDTMAESLQQREEELGERTDELERSNEELEQFAYIASHDLQEPLRMIASYTQLLKKRYSDKLDEDAIEFIDYAVDGANRMQVLINDLLKYSRVGTKGEEFTHVNMNDVLDMVKANLKAPIEETGAVVEHGKLPTIMADSSQMVQLFQNLIGNAIKFRKEGETPKIEIFTEKKGKFFRFGVKDNGIGIEEKYLERIFVIFQRLHTRDEFPGTGIGLAICKKIVERHGGEITVESISGEGSTFLFTLPGKE
ncbi:ATP-binding protein [Limisalsivibrio acetivorans]|uniref:ATP-binding protein n=1 Tax=Limisalsivibrio acetivorans TaxID=1304888 RepID=UPI0003B40E43|nr:ATP-binding protein [Limisalsivibrio acetivorans]